MLNGPDTTTMPTNPMGQTVFGDRRSDERTGECQPRSWAADPDSTGVTEASITL
jgi:hypothetical protein